MKKSIKSMPKNIKEIEREIAGYDPPAKIANVMRKLGNAGFEFSGHGTDLRTGEEDFGLVYDLKKEKGSVYVSVSSKGNITVCVNFENDYKNLDLTKAVKKAITAKKVINILDGI